MKLLENKTALITGATRGIGKGIAEVFARQGANVAFTFLSSEKQARSIENELSVHGSMVKGYKSKKSSWISRVRKIYGFSEKEKLTIKKLAKASKCSSKSLQSSVLFCLVRNESHCGVCCLYR